MTTPNKIAVAMARSDATAPSSCSHRLYGKVCPRDANREKSCRMFAPLTHTPDKTDFFNRFRVQQTPSFAAKCAAVEYVPATAD